MRKCKKKRGVKKLHIKIKSKKLMLQADAKLALSMHEP